jgi:uncharacterized protein
MRTPDCPQPLRHFDGFSGSMILFLISALLCASQIYWALRAWRLVRRHVPPRLHWLTAILLLSIYLALLAYHSEHLFDFPAFGPQPNPTSLGFSDATLALLQWWMLCSTLALGLALPVEIFRSVLRRRMKRRAAERRRAESITPTAPADRPIQPLRRHFLEHVADATLAAPFVLGAYALLYERLNLEITHRRVPMARLSSGFRGFRILQLSDIHISAFMSEDQIRKFAAIANSQHADLIALTGDFVTWDPAAQTAVVSALSTLKAPFGVFGCLGNHEAWSGTKDSITELFAHCGIQILRDSCQPINHGKDQLNLIGIEPDYGWSTHEIPEDLVWLDGPNVLLSHYPTVFENAASQNIELTLAGHTHGGQVKLDFISPQLAPRFFHTPYIAGAYEINGSRLYVNRGIGTIGLPMRAGVPPEMTVFELVG